MAKEIEEICGNCTYWRMLEGQAERPLWGTCKAAQGLKGGALLQSYIRPVPKNFETVERFGCVVFMPSAAVIKKTVHDADK